MNKSVKIILVILMLLCIVDMPYGFYQFVRFIALVGFSALAYMAYRQQREIEMIIYITLTVLFQPLFKVALGRELWNIVDIVVAMGLLVSLYIKPKKNE
jgi:hypothetical protein